jgi:hypothetical protein
MGNADSVPAVFSRFAATSRDARAATMAGAEKEVRAGPRAKRELFVDVRNRQAHIVEVVGGESGSGQIRRLREQRFTQVERMEAERLKRQIVFSENGGSYDLRALYRPQTDDSAATLARLVEDLERRDGEQVWDRRRSPR